MLFKVAVLEFELRKAKDAIRSLRNNLTVVTESTPDAVVPNGTFLAVESLLYRAFMF